MWLCFEPSRLRRTLTRQGRPAGRAVAGARTDGQIEMDVVHALDGSPALKNDLITAATIQTEVTLSGTVASDASKQLAESIASHVDGVTKVHNNLKVGNPAQDAQNMPPADASAQEMPDNQPLPRHLDCRLRDRRRIRTQTRRSRRLINSQYPRSPRQPQSRHRVLILSAAGELSALLRSSGLSTRIRSTRNIRRTVAAYAASANGPAYEAPHGPVTVPQGTLLYLRTCRAGG